MSYVERITMTKINEMPMTGIEALQLLFIGLKLTDNIDWGWIWVLSPAWIMLLVLTVIGILDHNSD